MIYVGHLFICLYDISISPSVEYLVKSPAFFFFLPNWVVSLLLSFALFFIFWIFFYRIYQLQSFPTSLWIAFSLFKCLLQNRSFAILLKSNLSLFILYHVLGVITMTSLPDPQSKRFSSFFSPKCTVLDFCILTYDPFWINFCIRYKLWVGVSYFA